MNAFVSEFYRDATCGAGALLITLVLSAAFVQATSAAPGHAPQQRTRPGAVDARLVRPA